MPDISGPVTVDPLKVMRVAKDPGSQEAEALLNQKLREIAQGRDPRSSFKKLEDSIWDAYNNTMNKDTCLTIEQFKRFEILYSRQVQADYLAGKLDTATVQQIQDLSEEFYHTVNTQRPIHIVDADGNDVCPPLPPVFRPLRKIMGKGTQVLDFLHNAFLHADDIPNSPSTIKQKQAVDAVGQLIMAGQDKETLLHDVQETNELANNFHKAVFGKPVFDEPVTADTKPTDAAPPQHDNAASFMAFGDVEDDD